MSSLEGLVLLRIIVLCSLLLPWEREYVWQSATTGCYVLQEAAAGYFIQKTVRLCSQWNLVLLRCLFLKISHRFVKLTLAVFNFIISFCRRHAWWVNIWSADVRYFGAEFFPLFNFLCCILFKDLLFLLLEQLSHQFLVLFERYRRLEPASSLSILKFFLLR